MARKIKGAYSLLVLTKDGIYAARSPNGHWSLVVGKKEGAVVVASESGGFPNYGVKLVRDIKPGEIVLIKNGDLETKDIIHSERIQFCSFFWVYTAFPNAVLEGISASLVRKRLGAALARRDIKRGFIPDIVIPVPYSGIFHALGYHEEFCRQAMEGKISRIPPFDFALLKFPWSGRSFTPPDARTRKFKAHVKLLISGENYAGKTVVACDDSVVRGTQTKTVLMPKLRSIGIEDVHLRVSNPPLLSHCPWGKTTKKGEPLAYRMPEKADRVDFLGVKSLEYNTVEDLVQAIGLPAEQLCVDCDLVCGS